MIESIQNDDKTFCKELENQAYIFAKLIINHIGFVKTRLDIC